MKPQTYHRRVHGPGHVRDLFCDVIEYAAERPWGHSKSRDPILSALREQRLSEHFMYEDSLAEWNSMKPAERKRWLRGKLWHCSSIVPGPTRQELQDLLEHEREKVITYAQAVKSELFE